MNEEKIISALITAYTDMLKRQGKEVKVIAERIEKKR